MESKQLILDAVGQARETLGRALANNDDGDTQVAIVLLADAVRELCGICLKLADK